METIEIPGGQATLLSSPGELTAGRRRPIELLSSRIGRKMQLISAATRLICDGDVVLDNSEAKNEDGSLTFPGGDFEISERDLALVSRMNDVLVASLLKSWTLDRPVPAGEEEVRDLEVPLYDVLLRAVARINAQMRNQEAAFEPDAGMEDPASPTGG